MWNSILLPVYAGLLGYGTYDIAHDSDYNIKLKQGDKAVLAMAYVVSSLILLVLSFPAAVFCTAGMAILHISAITDSKRMLVPFGYIYVMVPLAIICECFIFHKFSCFSLIFLAVAVLGNIIGAYNVGDILLIFLVAENFYLYSHSILFSSVYLLCVMFIAEIFLICSAAGNKNINYKQMKFKHPMPLGGYLLSATYIVTIGYIIINSIKG